MDTWTSVKEGIEDNITVPIGYTEQYNLPMDSVEVKIEDDITIDSEYTAQYNIPIGSVENKPQSHLSQLQGANENGYLYNMYEELPAIKQENLEDEITCYSKQGVKNPREGTSETEKSCFSKHDLIGEPRVFSSHSESEMEPEKPLYECKKCPRSFATKTSLRMHFIRSHSGYMESQRINSNCDICGGPTASRSALLKHMSSHMKGKRFACDLCPKTFALKGGLANHRRCHTGEKPFLCDLCGRAFAQLGDMNIHRTIHTGQKAHQCRHCGKEFRKSGDLHRHIRRMHTRQGLFQCNNCDRQLATPEELVRHERSHSGEKPFKCGECGKAFSMNWLVAKHARLVHEPGGPFFCEICGKIHSETCKKLGHARVNAKEKRLLGNN